MSSEVSGPRAALDARTSSDARAALVAGAALALMAVLGGFAGVVAIGGLYAPGDVEGTARDVAESVTLLRWGALAFLLVAFLDVVVAWALKSFLLPVDRELSLLAAWLRTGYAVTLLVGVGHLVRAADLAEREAAAGEVHGALATFQSVWDVGLALFGAHLLLVGWLCLVASTPQGHTPALRWVGALVLIAGLGYVVDAVAVVLGLGLGIGEVTFVGEVVLLIWLLWFGLRGSGDRGSVPPA